MVLEDEHHVKMALDMFHYMSNCSELFSSNSSIHDIMENCTDAYNAHERFKHEGLLYDVPSEVIILLSIFYGTISVVAVVGNFLVIWIVTTSRRMQNVTNCFIANLALADIVIGLFAIPFQFQAALLQRWNLPHFMCPFCPFVQVLSVTVSIFTLTAIALDRHRAILNPLRVYPSRYRAKVCIAGIWAVAFFIALPMAMALRVEEVEEYVDSMGNIHTKPFCHNTELPNEVMLCYRILILLVQYIVPLCIITCVYTRMAFRLWGSHAPGNAQFIRDATLMKNKKKVIKMLVIVVVLFALCWLPLQAYMVLQDIFPVINTFKYINIIFFVCDWLAMSNSCYNPFIYGIYNEKFKREFKQRFPFRSRKWRSSTIESLDTEKTLVAGRPSVRSTTTTIDWRSNNFNNRSAYCRSTLNDNYKSSKCGRSITNQKYKDKDLYVLQSTRGGTIVHCASESEFEELCL